MKILENLRLFHPQAGYRLLSWTVAGLMLFHGVHKLLHGGVDRIAEMLVASGLPGFIAYGVLIGEAAAPALVLAGFFVGPAAVVMAVNMLFAIGLAHGPQLLTLNDKTGGYALELQAFFLLGSLATALMAPRRGYKLLDATR